MSVAMTNDTENAEKDSFDEEFDGTAATADSSDAAYCDASFSHTCACTI